MKTSKRKRSSKSEPAAPALDVVDAPAAAGSAEPVVALEPIPAESVVAEPVVAANEAVVAEAPSATEGEPVVVLAANCSVKDATALKSSLCAVANESAAVTLDATAVERVDTATMQLLCAFVRDRSSRSQSTVWRGQSQALHDAVRLLGVAALIGFDIAMGVAA
jgi:ABC-type transporter Mla MlaB component